MREQIKTFKPTLAQKMHIPGAPTPPPIVAPKKPNTKTEQNQEDAESVTRASRAPDKN